MQAGTINTDRINGTLSGIYKGIWHWFISAAVDGTFAGEVS